MCYDLRGKENVEFGITTCLVRVPGKEFVNSRVCELCKMYRRCVLSRSESVVFIIKDTLYIKLVAVYVDISLLSKLVSVLMVVDILISVCISVSVFIVVLLSIVK